MRSTYRSSKKLKMETGFDSNARLESHFGGDANNSFNLDVSSGPSPTGGYFYNGTPSMKSRASMKGDVSHSSNFTTEDSLARKLFSLTNSLSQGKPIIVGDLMSLRPNNEADSRAVQLISELQSELRLAANLKSDGKLDYKFPVLIPTKLDLKGHSQKHVTYSEDETTTDARRWTQLVPNGVRSTFLALMSHYGFDIASYH